MIRLIMLFFIGLPFVSTANDSLKILSENAFIEIVRNFHPVAKQAQLLVDRAKADLIASRSGFDPEFYVYADRKTFDGKVYYDYTNPELKIPTWFGVDLKAGLEENIGNLVNPELSPGRSSYLGVSLPLAKNLLMDKRRAALRQAKLFRDQSRSEQLLTINNLLMDAYEAYWYWVRTYETFMIISETVAVNKQRYALINIGFQQGDRPALDTTEALAQLQSFELAREQAYLEWRNATLELSNFTWTDSEAPVLLPDDVVPDNKWKASNIVNAQVPVLQDVLMQARAEHPKLIIYNFKLDILDIERKLKFQNLLPTADFSYNFLSKGYSIINNPSAALFNNNYKFGFTIGMPLRLSQGRGEYKVAKIKIRETNLDLIQDRLAIDNKIKSYFNELSQLRQQVRIAEDALANYTRLFQGEDFRFKAGESSLFLLNSRENKVLEARQKLIELKTKFYKAYRSLGWAAGQLR
ncbi:MAG: hypothetical protein RL335_1538 [Bacteroidota bacterium]